MNIKLSIMAFLLLSLFIAASFSSNNGIIDLDNLFNYEDQNIPAYILKDNTPIENPITNKAATLGRVLFYDKALSINNTIACASCHQQQFAFSDTAQISTGVNGQTGRHSMRLINTRFSNEVKFFWDERAVSLEDQTTHPIQDHKEMGFSGSDGDPDLDSLIRKLETIDYYSTLFDFVYGSTDISETKIQKALAQFIRSIQSFDAKYDLGRQQVNNDAAPFPNFSADENAGKNLFLTPPNFNPNGVRVGGGLGCGGCHRAPEFDIDPNSLSNGIVRELDASINPNITRSPSLRDLVNPDGTLNGLLMHRGDFTLAGTLTHYNQITLNPGIDPRLTPGGNPQNLNLTNLERTQVSAFLRTLTGTNVYTDSKWSNPFDESGNITLVGGITSTNTPKLQTKFNIFPNPTTDVINIDGNKQISSIRIIDISGKTFMMLNGPLNNVNLQQLPAGIYFLQLLLENNEMQTVKIVKK